MIELIGVSTGYGQGRNQTIVSKELTLTAQPGQITVLLGPNGCGKSTLLRTAAGLKKSLGGTVLLEGVDIAGLSLKKLAGMRAFLPQSRDVPPLTVRETVMAGRYADTGLMTRGKGTARQKADEAMVRMGVSKWADEPMTKLSGGQRQRAYLAMMLCQNAPILMLDEPLTGLDFEAVQDLVKLLREFKERGNTVLLSLHDWDTAFHLADRLVLMDREGAILEKGSPEELAERQAFLPYYHVRCERVSYSGGTRILFIKENETE